MSLLELSGWGGTTPLDSRTEDGMNSACCERLTVLIFPLQGHEQRGFLGGIRTHCQSATDCIEFHCLETGLSWPSLVNALG